MALASGTIWEIRASATTGNTGGSGFNTANANFLTDLAATSATGDSPVLTSASYNFAAGDVGAWVYIKSGTNWTPGWYQIASVAANAATVSAAVGQAIQLDTFGNYSTNTVAGVATVASPTAGTFGVDYSQQNTAQTTATDFAAVGASTTLTSATAAFTPVMVGNIFHQTTTGTGAFGVVGWYEIVSYVNATTVVLDRTPNTGTASVACTGFVGGAGRLNGLEDAFFEMIPAASTVWVKSGTYTFSASISIASTNSTTTNPSNVIGYTSLRGDTCNGTSRPLLAMGANSMAWGSSQNLINLIFTISAAGGVSLGTSSTNINCKFSSTSSTAGRSAVSSGTNMLLFGCEATSQNGSAINYTTSGGTIYGCYFHDSATGITSSTSGGRVFNCIIETCSTDAINVNLAATVSSYISNTVYGREAKMGTGFNFNNATSTLNRLIGNIIYGCTTGITVLTTQQDSNMGLYNDYFNNTTDVTNWRKTSTALALDPQFAGATQITGSTATTSGSVLTQSGGDFSTVTDSVDYLRVISGTGVTTGGYLIIAHTTTTVTVNLALGTSSGGDVVYYVSTGHNFAIGANLKGRSFPGAMGTETTGYIDVGAVQRQEPTLASTFSS